MYSVSGRTNHRISHWLFFFSKYSSFSGCIFSCWILLVSAVSIPVKRTESDDSFRAKSHANIHKQHVLFNWNDYTFSNRRFPGRQVWACPNIRGTWNTTIHICSKIWGKKGVIANNPKRKYNIDIF